jgi:hypothetical protein
LCEMRDSLTTGNSDPSSMLPCPNKNYWGIFAARHLLQG